MVHVETPHLLKLGPCQYCVLGRVFSDSGRLAWIFSLQKLLGISYTGERKAPSVRLDGAQSLITLCAVDAAIGMGGVCFHRCEECGQWEGPYRIAEGFKASLT